MKKYIAKQWNHLTGTQFSLFSEDQIDEHLKLYAGYVHNLNLLQENLYQLMHDKKFNHPTFNELKRRFGWEFNGVKLHEYYFENLAANESIHKDSSLAKKIINQFSSIEIFMEDFKKTGLIRGIGWVILYYDQDHDQLFNIWIDDHHIGHGTNLKPLLVMDVWEHAYCVDWKPTERARYIDTFSNSIRWSVVEERLEECQKK